MRTPPRGQPNFRNERGTATLYLPSLLAARGPARWGWTVSSPDHLPIPLGSPDSACSKMSIALKLEKTVSAAPEAPRTRAFRFGARAPAHALRETLISRMRPCTFCRCSFSCSTVCCLSGPAGRRPLTIWTSWGWHGIFKALVAPHRRGSRAERALQRPRAAERLLLLRRRLLRRAERRAEAGSHLEAAKMMATMRRAAAPAEPETQPAATHAGGEEGAEGQAARAPQVGHAPAPDRRAGGGGARRGEVGASCRCRPSSRRGTSLAPAASRS